MLRVHRDEVFVAGGQPTVTYVNRGQINIERDLARAIATPNQIVSLAGPTSRKSRKKRPLKVGGEVDIYEATLLALAQTGPKPSVKYDELRDTMNLLLAAGAMPQKNEITSAIKHLTVISRKDGAEAALDWDDDKQAVNIIDPWLRFYLRWQVRHQRHSSH